MSIRISRANLMYARKLFCIQIKTENYAPNNKKQKHSQCVSLSFLGHRNTTTPVLDLFAEIIISTKRTQCYDIFTSWALLHEHRYKHPNFQKLPFTFASISVNNYYSNAYLAVNDVDSRKKLCIRLVEKCRNVDVQNFTHTRDYTRCNKTNTTLVHFRAQIRSNLLKFSVFTLLFLFEI